MRHIMHVKAISTNASNACSSRLSETAHTINTKSSSTFQNTVTGAGTHNSRQNSVCLTSLNVRSDFSRFLVWQ